MRIHFRFPGGNDGWDRECTRDVIPRLGEEIAVPDDDKPYRVATVIHYPWGDGDGEPFVFVVLQ